MWLTAATHVAIISHLLASYHQGKRPDAVVAHRARPDHHPDERTIRAMATRDPITGTTSRRDLLRRAGGATVTIAAAGVPITAAIATTAAAQDDPDAVLL